MAVIRHNIIFGGVDSADYGIHIGGEGTFNAPKRAVETYSIPGRNGDLILDGGHFENVELVYTAFNYEKDLHTFAQNLSDFRNALAAQKGYQKLTDSFNPTEYRMACFVDGIEIGPINYNTASQFEIKFNCKPQRYLMSGEVPIDVSSGDTILGPTLFDSHPMLEVTGYGEITINGEVMTVNNDPLGQVQLSKAGTSNQRTLDVSNLNTGDSIYKLEADKPQLEYGMVPKSGSFSTVEITSVTNCTAYVSGTPTKQKIIIVPDFPQIVKGTSASVAASVNLTLVLNGTTYNGEITVTLVYSGSANTIAMSIARSDMPTTSSVSYSPYYQHPAYYGDSTKLIAPTPMYLDLDIGEAYGVVNDEVLSFNNIVSMPAELPVLKPGSNTITFDNTVTDLKIVPRWWKI